MRIRWRGLELPSRVICNRETLNDTFGEFHVEPFERGFGHTVGNSLRRILLSSLEGSAITKIKILGVQHEFSSIPGMVDDITDLVLNVKLLVVKNHSEASRTIRIDRDRRGVVTAADILHDESVEIINPDHILCTLTDDVRIPPGNDRRERPGVPHGGRGPHRRPRDRRHPDRRQLQPGPAGRIPRREHPRRPADQLRQADLAHLDDRRPRSRDGLGRGRQDPPQALEPVRPVQRARPGPAVRVALGRRRLNTCRSTPSWSASSR